MRKVILPFVAVIVYLVSDIAGHAVTAMTSSPLTASAPENVRGRSFGPTGDNLVRQAIESRTLIFDERVTYQRAIEDVYWQPRKNGATKPSLDAVVSQAHIEKKVQDYLRNSPVTPEQLQVEIDRMAEHSKQPEVIQELFEAL